MTEEQLSEPPKWYCLRSQTKREHIAAAALRKQFHGEIEVFCPRIRYKKPTKRGPIWWVEPLFPGYLLAHFSLSDDLRNVLHTNGVSGAVQFGRRLPEVPASLVTDLQAEFEGDEEGVQNVLTIERRLGRGDTVELSEGAFRGISGKVLEVMPSLDRVQVLFEFLGEDRPVEVDILALILRERAD